MNIIRNRRKKRALLRHRTDWYIRAINLVIDGKVRPEYATERFKKLKEVRK